MRNIPINEILPRTPQNPPIPCQLNPVPLNIRILPRILRIPPLHKQRRLHTIRPEPPLANIMDHGNIDRERQPIVHFEKEATGRALGNGIPVRANGVFPLDNNAARCGVIKVVFEELGDPVIEGWVEVFFVFGEFHDVFVAVFFVKFLRGEEFFIACSQV